MQNETGTHTRATATELKFYKQYYTFQALLDIYSNDDMNPQQTYETVILYVMRWLKKRIGENNLERLKENNSIQILVNDYPDPDSLAQFNYKEAKDIFISDILDLRTFTWVDDNSWTFRLIGPDNGAEKGISLGRDFTTNIALYIRNDIVTLAMRTTCREPEENEEDAAAFRLGFVREMYESNRFKIVEHSLPVTYAFCGKAIEINGKAKSECDDLYSNTIINPKRQMPIVFVPETVYKSRNEDIDRLAARLLSYAHVIVIKENINKFFFNCLNDQELHDVIDEGQIVLFKGIDDNKKSKDAFYFDSEAPDVTEDILNICKKEIIRKNYKFYDFEFNRKQRKRYDKQTNLENDEYNKKYITLQEEYSELEGRYQLFKNDNEALHTQNIKLKQERDASDIEVKKYIRVNIFLQTELDKKDAELAKYKHEKENTIPAVSAFNKSQTLEILSPLVNLPKFKNNIRETIIDWIDNSYGDYIIVHERAKDEFTKCNKNLDWDKFRCAITYLAGYTKNINNGKYPNQNEPDFRMYDPFEHGFRVTPSNSGQGIKGLKREDKQQYEIDIHAYDDKCASVIMNYHIKYGKGQVDSTVRIYFYYDANIRKTIIGSMPEHLPTIRNKT